MSISFENSNTKINLMKAFAGESQARNRYTFAASQAKKEGLQVIQKVFEFTANQEKEHAKRFFKFLEGGDVMVEAAFPAGIIGSTEENLIAAANGEHEEWSDAYPKMAEVAEKEGFNEIATVWRAVSVAEKFHEERFRAFAENLKKAEVFERVSETEWRCRNCGYIHKGKSAPTECPACQHPQAYFELIARNW